MSEPRCYGYVRVSTPRQAEQGVSIDAQPEEIRAYCRERGLPEPEIFSDPAISAGKNFAARAAASELLARFRPGDVVVTTKIDRSWRTLTDFLVCYDEWSERGIKLHIIDLNGLAVDPDTPIGRLLIQMLGAFAEFERRMAGERIRAAHRYIRSQGLYLSVSRVPPGFKGVRNGKGVHAVPCPDERRLMGMIVRWYDDQGVNFRQVAAHLIRQRVPRPRRHDKTPRNQHRRYDRKPWDWDEEAVRRWYLYGKRLIEAEGTSAAEFLAAGDAAEVPS